MDIPGQGGGGGGGRGPKFANFSKSQPSNPVDKTFNNRRNFNTPLNPKSFLGKISQRGYERKEKTKICMFVTCGPATPSFPPNPEYPQGCRSIVGKGGEGFRKA